jgi:hypothetical protein
MRFIGSLLYVEARPVEARLDFKIVEIVEGSNGDATAFKRKIRHLQRGVLHLSQVRVTAWADCV